LEGGIPFPMPASRMLQDGSMINDSWCVYVSFDRLAFEKVVVKLNGLISISAVLVGILHDAAFIFTLLG
jgi:hypothetical protein